MPSLRFDGISMLLKKYHLQEGILLASLLPGIFVFSSSSGAEMLNRFVLSFFCILGFWMINFYFVDFSSKWSRHHDTSDRSIVARIFIATSCAIGFYLVVGFMDTSGLLLSQVRGELIKSPKAWFYLILRISLLNSLIILIKYVYDFTEEKRRIQHQNEILKRENALAMHESLKQQMSPHFLFNSLNTLKSLVKQNPERSLYFLDELAAIYKYMLMHSGKSEVTVREEINFSKSYLNLLKIRFGSSLSIDINVPEHFLESKMPFNTLQTLIENVVKHNILSQKRPLTISLYVHSGYLIVANNLQTKKGNDASSNVGLTNVNKRYKILYNQNILIQKSEEEFKVSLPIV
jgi:two-component system, LytTR family, sensor kinase